MNWLNYWLRNNHQHRNQFWNSQAVLQLQVRQHQGRAVPVQEPLPRWKRFSLRMFWKPMKRHILHVQFRRHRKCNSLRIRKVSLPKFVLPDPAQLRSARVRMLGKLLLKGMFKQFVRQNRTRFLRINFAEQWSWSRTTVGKIFRIKQKFS